MRHAVRTIDRALKHLYNLNPSYRAEHFLVKNWVSGDVSVGSSCRNFRGALLVQGDLNEGVSVGIYLDENTRRELSSFSRWLKRDWTHSQFAAFATAAEEVSHFQYLLHHAGSGRAVSQFELELQGEIDKFMLSFFALARGKTDVGVFRALFEQCFEQFRLEDSLSPEERSRYQNASNYAQRFVSAIGEGLLKDKEKLLSTLRRFYRLNSAEKVSSIQSLV